MELLGEPPVRPHDGVVAHRRRIGHSKERVEAQGVHAVQRHREGRGLLERPPCCAVPPELPWTELPCTELPEAPVLRRRLPSEALRGTEASGIRGGRAASRVPEVVAAPRRVVARP